MGDREDIAKFGWLTLETIRAVDVLHPRSDEVTADLAELADELQPVVDRLIAKSDWTPPEDS